jgi:hypothetical protein
MTTFTLSLAEFARAAPEQARAVVRKVATDVLTKTVLRSPVDTGRFRANWATSFGAPSYRVTSDTDASGQIAITRGARTISRAYGDYPIYITNSLPYAIPLEYGYSKQAPAGMVRITVAEFQTFVDNAVRTTKAAK